MPIKTPANEGWRVPFIKELIEVKLGSLYVELPPQDIKSIIDQLCI